MNFIKCKACHVIYLPCFEFWRGQHFFYIKCFQYDICCFKKYVDTLNYVIITLARNVYIIGNKKNERPVGEHHGQYEMQSWICTHLCVT